MRIALLSLLFAACVASPPSGAPAVPTPSLVTVRQPPRAPSPGKPPLLVLLHGIGTDEHDLLPLAKELDPRFAVVSVRGPYSMGPGANSWFAVQFRPDGNNTIDEGQWKRSCELLAKTIDETVGAMGADPGRVYLLGFSQGGMMAYSLALTAPSKYAGAVVMSSRLLPQIQPIRASAEALKDFPLLVMHGTQDPKLPVSLARSAREELEKMPVKLTYREFPMVHTITPESLATADAWLRERLDSPR